jgi:hypothetical protein
MRRRLDVVLAGVPKSGTTMLCNAMTVAGRAVVLYEPTRGGFRAERLRTQAASLGYHGRNILGWAREHEKWGVKEVLAEPIRKAVAWGPEHLVLLVRDLRQVALSTYETNQRIPWDLNYRRQRLLDTAQAVMELRRSWPSDRLTVCHYEEFVSSAEYREAFRQRVSWPTLEGDVARGLSTWLERPHEADRHKGRITANSVDYRRSAQEPEPQQFAREIMAACPSFNRVFGYPA